MGPLTPIAFLKLDGVKGSSTKANFEDQIPVHAYKHAMDMGYRLLHSEGTASTDPLRVFVTVNTVEQKYRTSLVHEMFRVWKPVDRASVILYDALNTNKPFKTGELSILQSLASGEIVSMRVAFEGIRLMSVAYEERSGDAAEEAVSFTYQKIEWTFKGLDTAGKSTGAVSAQIMIRESS